MEILLMAVILIALAIININICNIQMSIDDIVRELRRRKEKE